jgi:predicted secreted protein|tara:strand:- start:1349 stop:1849 length:501 start_codon:yes stop_codon:yes gene_type:complete
MATSGVLSGTDVFLRVLNTDTGHWESIGGQTSHSETLNNGPIDISNKIGVPSFREFLDVEGIQSIDITTEFVFNSQAAFEFIHNAAGNKSIELFQVQRGALDVGGADQFKLAVVSFQQTSQNGEALSATVGFQSSDSIELSVVFETLSASDGLLKASDATQLYVRS